MAKVSLFKTAQSLWDGYTDTKRTYRLDNNVSKGNGGRKVYLLGRQLSTGNISLYRYACHDGKRFRESLGIVLQLETNYNIKRENEEKIRLQVMACDSLNEELNRKDVNFAPKLKSKIRLVDWLLKLADDALQETGNRHSMYAQYYRVAKHVEIFDGKTTLGQVDEDWIRRFIRYLRCDALNLNYQRNGKQKKDVKLSQNTQHIMLAKLNQALRIASRGKNRLIASNPMQELDKKEKISARKGTREYIDESELRKLMATPFRHGNFNVKQAFIFACFTGLRFSDLQRLKMSDFRCDKYGRYLKIQMVKTQEPLKIYIPDVAFGFLPDVKDDDAPIFKLHTHNEWANVCLRKWVADAGINKYLSFHCARHSTATLLLSNGIPLQVIQRQLGHLKIQTTEIYAKLMDSAQSQASKMFDEKFGSHGNKE